MIKMLKFEWLKMKKKKYIQKVLISVMIIQVIFAIFINYNPDFMSYEKATQYTFHTSVIINISTIFYICQSFAEEFQFRTIIAILIRNPKREIFFLSKLIVSYGVYFFLMLCTTISSLVISRIILQVTLTGELIERAFLNNYFSVIPITILLLLSIGIILITKKETQGLVFSLFTYVFYAFGTGLNFFVISIWEPFKYNIINIFNISNQIIDNRYQGLTMLTTNEMLLIAFIYIAIAFTFAYLVSKRLEV